MRPYDVLHFLIFRLLFAFMQFHFKWCWSVTPLNANIKWIQEQLRITKHSSKNKKEERKGVVGIEHANGKWFPTLSTASCKQLQEPTRRRNSRNDLKRNVYCAFPWFYLFHCRSLRNPHIKCTESLNETQNCDMNSNLHGLELEVVFCFWFLGFLHHIGNTKCNLRSTILISILVFVEVGTNVAVMSSLPYPGHEHKDDNYPNKAKAECSCIKLKHKLKCMNLVFFCSVL